MPYLRFYSTNSPAYWNDLSCWFEDISHTIPATSLPGINGDYPDYGAVIDFDGTTIIGKDYLSGDPVAFDSPIYITKSDPDAHLVVFNVNVSSNISLAVDFKSESSYSGTATLTGEIIKFLQGATNAGTITGATEVQYWSPCPYPCGGTVENLIYKNFLFWYSTTSQVWSDSSLWFIDPLCTISASNAPLATDTAVLIKTIGGIDGLPPILDQGVDTIPYAIYSTDFNSTGGVELTDSVGVTTESPITVIGNVTADTGTIVDDVAFYTFNVDGDIHLIDCVAYIECTGNVIVDGILGPIFNIIGVTGTIGGDVTINSDSAFNNATVSGNGYFNGVSSYNNENGTIIDDAYFNGINSVNSGIVNGDAWFIGEGSYNFGIINGNAYFIGDLTFDAGISIGRNAYFSGYQTLWLGLSVISGNMYFSGIESAIDYSASGRELLSGQIIELTGQGSSQNAPNLDTTAGKLIFGGTDSVLTGSIIGDIYVRYPHIRPFDATFGEIFIGTPGTVSGTIYYVGYATSPVIFLGGTGYSALKSTGVPEINPDYFRINTTPTLSFTGDKRYLAIANRIHLLLLPVSPSDNLSNIGKHYGLAVYNDTSATEAIDTITGRTAVTKIRTVSYQIYNSGNSYCLKTNSVTGSFAADIGGTMVLHSSPLAVTNSGDLLVVPITGTIEDEDVVHIGDRALRVVKINGDWCLVVSY